ncbi:MAG: guanitoxin biosynthesis L-enduracididine beta-hydroxylase GntD [Candidatus Tectomicrobia bacterium]
MIKHLVLTEPEIQDIRVLLETLTKAFATPEDPRFIHDAVLYAHDLPFRVRQGINDFRLSESDGETICLISGYPIDDQKIGPTPPNREVKNDTPRTLEEQMLLVLCAALLGESFGWFTQQMGFLVNDILPVKGHEYQQVGSSSEEPLTWHTEEAFHPYRCDYLGLMCLRNPNQGATMVASTEVVSGLSEDQIRILFEPRFTIRPDEIHFENHRPTLPAHLNGAQAQQLLQRAYDTINQMNTNPTPMAVLFGDPASPYMCMDSLYLEGLDEEADRVVKAFIRAIDEQLTDLVLQAGEICFIDNYRTVHGRRAFKANYDGTDRWLKRLNITRDLRKSRSMRLTTTSRFIF